MKNKTLIKKLKRLAYEESCEEIENIEEGFEYGIMSNKKLYDRIVSIIDYYKELD